MWRALADKTEFGAWFGVHFALGTFVQGETVSWNITYPGYEHLMIDIEIVEVTLERTFAYRWHPYAIDPKVDYSSEPIDARHLHARIDGDGKDAHDRRVGLRQHPAASPRRGVPDGRNSWSTSSAMSLRRSSAALKRYAPIFAALGDATRLHVLARLSSEGPLSITQLTEGPR